MSTAQQHLVQQGECLAAIARRYGFADYRTVYEDASNAELRRKRPNPNVIHPGDVVALPRKESKEVVAGTGRVHRFVMPGPGKVLRVRVLDAEGNPVAGEDASVAVDGVRMERRTGSDGALTVPAAVGASKAVVTIRGRELEFALCHLNPAVEAPDEGASGVQQRLRNLGYFRGAATGRFDRGTRLALWLFQFDEGLVTDGRPTAETVRRLEEAHGC